MSGRERRSSVTASWPLAEASMRAVQPIFVLCVNGNGGLGEQQFDDCNIAKPAGQHECCPTLFLFLSIKVDVWPREKKFGDCIMAILGSHHECCRSIFVLCVNGNVGMTEQQFDNCTVAIPGSQHERRRTMRRLGINGDGSHSMQCILCALLTLQ